jgi:hypothetical protein
VGEIANGYAHPTLRDDAHHADAPSRSTDAKAVAFSWTTGHKLIDNVEVDNYCDASQREGQGENDGGLGWTVAYRLAAEFPLSPAAW